MKVYVITKGEYSGYGICGVAIDKDKAEILRKFYSDRYDEAEIEEYDTEEEEIQNDLRTVYGFTIGKKGEVLNEAQFMRSEREWKNKFSRYGVEHFFYAEVMAVDRDHALKIALDERAKMLAERFGL